MKAKTKRFLELVGKPEPAYIKAEALEVKFNKGIEEILAAPITCHLKYTDICGVCVGCLYGMKELEAVRLRGKLGIKGVRGRPVIDRKALRKKK